MERLSYSCPARDGPKMTPWARFISIPWMLYGVLAVCLAFVMYFSGVAAVLPGRLLGLDRYVLPVSEWLVWFSGMPLVAGCGLILFDLFVCLPKKRRKEDVRFDLLSDRKVTVALTAYNDESSIAEAVKDFGNHPLVEQVIVVSNNSSDATYERAQAAGAVTFNEPTQGYGQCVYRCLTEAVRLSASELIVLCEGDRTFRAFDLDKLLAYAPHADIVNGTRTVEALRQYSTQLSTFMYYGNFFVGKLLESKHLGKSTVTDAGTTYKLCRKSALKQLLPRLDRRINLEFNAYFLDSAMYAGFAIVECPITFHPRVGLSKGGNTDNKRALQVGIRMASGIIFGWGRSDS